MKKPKLIQSQPFCPQSVTCYVQDGGNLPPLPVSSNPTAGGNLFEVNYKTSNVAFMRNVGFVLAVITIGNDKYKYQMSHENFCLIKRICDDYLDKTGYQLGLKRLIWLCKRYSYDKRNIDLVA